MCEFVRSFVHAHVPDRDVEAVENKITTQTITMSKRAKPAKAPRVRTKKGCLTHRCRRDLGLNKLLPTDASYTDHLRLNQLWLEYMKFHLRDYIKPQHNFQAEPWDSRTSGFSVLLNKADLHGAILRVVEARSPCLVGISGIVLVESKHMFQLLTAANRLKKVPKQNVIFEADVEGFQLRLFGSYLLQRPSFRGYKKPQPYTTVQL